MISFISLYLNLTDTSITILCSHILVQYIPTDIYLLLLIRIPMIAFIAYDFFYIFIPQLDGQILFRSHMCCTSITILRSRILVQYISIDIYLLLLIWIPIISFIVYDFFYSDHTCVVHRLLYYTILWSHIFIQYISIDIYLLLLK